MSCTPGITFMSRRTKKNPYADRGLTEFKLLSAELEAKRKKLLAQLDTPLSLVRFTSGSDHTKWIPIIICPTLSTEKLRAIRQAATNLISDDRDVSINDAAKSAPISGHIPPLDVKASEGASCGDVSTVEKLTSMSVAAEKFLWMAAFGLSIVADILRNAIGLKARPNVPQKSKPISSRQDRFNKQCNSSATIASSTSLLTPKAAPATIQRPQRMKTNGPSHTPHLKIARGHIKCDNAGFSTAPSTPTNSRQLRRPLLTSISLPKTCSVEEGKGNTKQMQLCTTMSLPRKTTCSEELDPQRGSSSTDSKAYAQRMGQALTGAGVALGLGGLVMGYFPAVVSIVCWWYLLPTLRKAVGDKPNIVKSHHHQQRS